MALDADRRDCCYMQLEAEKVKYYIHPASLHLLEQQPYDRGEDADG
jgi:hypothetical protein